MDKFDTFTLNLETVWRHSANNIFNHVSLYIISTGNILHLCCGKLLGFKLILQHKQLLTQWDASMHRNNSTPSIPKALWNNFTSSKHTNNFYSSPLAHQLSTITLVPTGAWLACVTSSYLIHSTSRKHFSWLNPGPCEIVSLQSWFHFPMHYQIAV